MPFDDKGLVFRQGGFVEPEVIARGLLEPHRRMLPLGCHLLGQDVLDRVGAKGLRPGGPLPGVNQGWDAVFVLERQELLDTLFQGRIGRDHLFERALGGCTSREKSRHLLGVPMASVVLLSGFAVLGEFDAVCALPTAQRSGDGLVLKVARQMVVVGFDGEGVANAPRGHGRGMAIKAHGEIGMDLGWGRLTAIREQRWSRAHRLGGKTRGGRLAGGACGRCHWPPGRATDWLGPGDREGPERFEAARSWAGWSG